MAQLLRSKAPASANGPLQPASRLAPVEFLLPEKKPVSQDPHGFPRCAFRRFRSTMREAIHCRRLSLLHERNGDCINPHHGMGSNATIWHKTIAEALGQRNRQKRYKSHTELLNLPSVRCPRTGIPLATAVQVQALTHYGACSTSRSFLPLARLTMISLLAPAVFCLVDLLCSQISPPLSVSGVWDRGVAGVELGARPIHSGSCYQS